MYGSEGDWCYLEEAASRPNASLKVLSGVLLCVICDKRNDNNELSVTLSSRNGDINKDGEDIVTTSSCTKMIPSDTGMGSARL